MHGILNGKGLDRNGELQFIKKTANFKKGEKVFTSGLGGIYPKDVKIGYVKNIEQVNSTINILEIKLLSNPLDGDLFGVLKY